VNKNNTSIQLNMDAYNKIELTKIDLYGLQPHLPYPSASPMFPQYTTSKKIDYQPLK
jgi:hypothetical protein